ncbi:head GIN domain-containing protein [Flavobacterium sp. 123]|uniref:head GIN domain-containing protein n=1 Tax=Flavobacterium sp. 123 TaxID=2135627 RepID=UPI000EB172C6|nr:head GIN domain-containing protein [Flavobacterium sp. 123]RKS99439.1 putative autotransporter adhesin-like protein [Flavobacterium sp. 123]
MKKLIAVAILFIAYNSNAQVTKNLGDFDTVKVFDQLNVKLISSSENKIVITGNRENEVEVLNKNGELKLRMPFPKLLSGNDITIKLYFKQLESISASEGSFVSSDYIFKQTSLDLNAKEGAQITVKLDVQKAGVKLNSGGIIELSGKALNQDVVITSGGILKAADLSTSQTSISVAAGGNAEVNASTLVDAKVKAGGTIHIYGKPKQINKQTIIGGTITEE